MGELLDRGGQRVLLAREPGDEPSTPHEATVLEPAQCPLHIAPREGQRVVGDEITEHHTPPLEHELGDGLGQLVAIDVGAACRHERPTAGTDARRAHRA